MDLRLAPMTLLAGVAAGVATVAVHQWWWGLLLAVAATLLTLVAAPPGWSTRLPFAVGFAGSVLLLAVPRGEGDYLLGSTVAGYAVLGFALVVVMIALATLPRPGRTSPRPTEAKAVQE
jgi:hypothetical protein